MTRPHVSIVMFHSISGSFCWHYILVESEYIGRLWCADQMTTWRFPYWYDIGTYAVPCWDWPLMLTCTYTVDVGCHLGLLLVIQIEGTLGWRHLSRTSFTPYSENKVPIAITNSNMFRSCLKNKLAMVLTLVNITSPLNQWQAKQIITSTLHHTQKSLQQK